MAAPKQQQQRPPPPCLLATEQHLFTSSRAETEPRRPTPPKTNMMTTSTTTSTTATATATTSMITTANSTPTRQSGRAPARPAAASRCAACLTPPLPRGPARAVARHAARAIGDGADPARRGQEERDSPRPPELEERKIDALDGRACNAAGQPGRRTGHQQQVGAGGPPPGRRALAERRAFLEPFLLVPCGGRAKPRPRRRMVGHLPAVLFPPAMTVGELRTTKPVLFLAVLAAASSETSALQRQLVRETMQVLAEKVVITGEKSLELVQALQLTTIWYWPPEHYEELKFYQLVHMAAVMAIDIGLGKRSAAPQGITPYGVYGVYAYRHAQHRRTQLPDPQSLEARRAWLACYYLSSNTAMALHRPLLIRWTKFMADSMEILRTAPDAAPTDKYFCGLVDTHRVSEDVAAQFATAEPEDAINVRDPGVTFSLRRLKRDLDTSYNMLPPDLHRTTLTISYHVVKIYMHEMIINVCSSPAARTNHPAEISLQDIAATSPLSGLHPLHVNAYSACLSSCHAIFDTFLATDIATLRCLPVFNLVRISYALVVLIKMFFCAVAPGSELAGIMGRDDLKVHTYVNQILEHFRAAAADDGSRPASNLGITGPVNFPIQPWPPAFSSSSSSSLGPHADTSMAEDPASAEACVRYALAIDPWVGQFGDVLDGVRAGGGADGAGGPAGGGPGGSGGWAGPAQQFQM
ncbi:conserved hypothetical protein [Verticillium alfalfae VaMs.102]|uniref:Transcription factor domain-containing protein n=1 Tax=Verticillium alfalfae (strain VaMs.102 / ATCC MYA-4576 / FGSC 10136) TaxID=526221 RepID=C9SIX3_VERA1|nr:conserved hypothetical protein [Verticillium alfalfae VaMs.102]EEY18896.1 conserved hypothetical protein [Verticillium alfalfae VaMs.102]